MKSEKKPIIFDMLILLLLLGLAYFPFSGARPLVVPDEGRYVEIPQQMLVKKDFVTPYINEIEYLEKPALFYWIEAVPLKLFGTQEWALRLPPILFGVLGCLFIYFAGFRLFNRQTAVFSSLILASNIFYFMMAQTINLDMVYSVFQSIAILLCLMAIELPRHAKKYFIAASAFVGLSVMTKGLTGMIFPCLILSLWLVFFPGKMKQFLKAPWLRMILIFALIVLPWHIAIQIKHPEFFRYYFYEQHFLRFFTAYAGREKAWWFFIPVLLVGFLPWSIFMIQSFVKTLGLIKRNFTESSKQLFLLTWFGLVFTFFSLSHSKLVPYILPSIPPLALLLGHYFSNSLAEKPSRGKIYLLLPLLTLSLLYTVFLISVHYIPGLDNPAMIIHNIRFSLLIIGVGLLFLLCLRRTKHPMIPCYLTALTLMMSYIPLSLTIPYVEEVSAKPIAQYLKTQLLKQNGTVFTYGHYYHDLPVYLGQSVKIIDWHNELRFGEDHQPDAKNWLLDKEAFRTVWDCQKQKLFVVLSKEDLSDFQIHYPKSMILFTTKHDVVLRGFARD